MPPVGGPGIIAGSAAREFYGNAVATVTALKAVGPDDRFDKQSRFVEGPPLDEYVFDAQSAAAESLPDVVAPDSGSGRWLRHKPTGGVPASHAPTHSDAGTDEISVEALGTAEGDATLSLMPDGSGGLAFGAPAPAAHTIGGALHTADSLVNLNTKIVNAHLDPIKVFVADQFSNPVNADWAVNALAPAVADSNNAGC